LKSGSLNLLEPSGPVQACNGNASPLLLTGVIITLFLGITFSRFISLDSKLYGVLLNFVKDLFSIFANDLGVWNALKIQGLLQGFEDCEQTEILERGNVISCSRCGVDDVADSPVHVLKSPRFV
jgi:hypothetical protein